jgi:hypothetical protein
MEGRVMTFGDKFRGIRVHKLMDGYNREQIRDHIRKFQLRNDGSHKETRPK